MTDLPSQILECDDVQRVKLHIPEWGLDVWVHSLASIDLDAYEESMLELEDDALVRNAENARARLAVLTVFDADGRRVFSDEQAAALGRKNGRALTRIWTVSRRLNGMTNADIEDLVKNSGGGPGADSGSGSPPSGDAP